MFGAARVQSRFKALVSGHHDDLRAYVTFLTRRATETDDLVQEAFLLAFDRLAEGKDFAGDPGKWLRGVARNLVHAWWRDRQRMLPETADFLASVADEADDAAALAMNVESRKVLGGCMEKLRSPDRDLVMRFYRDGKAITDLAEQMKQTASNIKVRLFRIRSALRACLEKQVPAQELT